MEVATEITHLERQSSIKIHRLHTHAHMEEETRTHTKEVTIKFTHTRRNVHDTRMELDDVTLHTSFPLVLNALQAKWKWLRTWRSLSGFVKLEQYEENNTPLNNICHSTIITGKSYWILPADLIASQKWVTEALQHWRNQFLKMCENGLY